MWKNDDEKYPIFRIIDPNALKEAEKGMDLLPSKNLNYPKDKAWNRKIINSMFLQGITEGQAVQKIARNILPEINSKSGEGELEKSVIKRNRQSAIRNARTMVTSAENGGRMASYKELDQMGIVQKKEWMATPDDRTRASHIDIDGEEQDINDRFSNGLMYPADPNGAAEEVWMCRCSMADHIVGFRKADGSISKVQYTRDRTMHEDQMAEERDRRLAAAKATLTKKGIPAKEVDSMGYADKIKTIAEDVIQNGLTDEKIMEAGQILADEVNVELDARKAEFDKASEAFDKAGNKEVQEILRDPKYKEAGKIRWEDGWRGKVDWSRYQYFTNVADADAYYEPRWEKIKAIEGTEKYKETQAAYVQALKKVDGDPKDNAAFLRDKLSQIREMGSEGIDIKAHLNNSKSPMRKDIEYAYNQYPKSWVEKSVAKGNLRCGTVQRGYYSEWKSEIMISGIADTDSAKETAIHELGHRFEHTMKNMLAAEQSFYNKRTAGEPLEWLGGNYAKDEKTRKDNFIDAYIGKDYNGTAFELNSMGFQYAFFDPTVLAKDKEMQAWILGQLAIIP